MQAPDCIAGSFSAFGGVLCFLSCWRLFRQKQVRGVSISARCFFTAWGVWNIFYFAWLDQWAAWSGGLVIVTANTLWVGQALYYTYLRRH